VLICEKQLNLSVAILFVAEHKASAVEKTKWVNSWAEIAACLLGSRLFACCG